MNIKILMSTMNKKDIEELKLNEKKYIKLYNNKSN